MHLQGKIAECCVMVGNRSNPLETSKKALFRPEIGLLCFGGQGSGQNKSCNRYYFIT